MDDDAARVRLFQLELLTAMFNRPHVWIGDVSLTRFIGFLAGVDAMSGLVPSALGMPRDTEAFAPFRRPPTDGHQWLPLVVLESLASRPLPDEEAISVLAVEEQQRLRAEVTALYAAGFDELRRRHAAEHGLPLGPVPHTHSPD